MINESEKTKQLLLRFQKFEIVKCGMYHEHIVLDVNKKAVYKEDNNTIIFNREKLCNTEVRAVRLGCAHSSSNHNFEELLDSLSALLPRKSLLILNLKNEFKAVVSRIYMLDHKKGQLEHDLALCKITLDYSENEALAQLSCRIKEEHNMLMEDLVEIKANIKRLIRVQ